MQDKQENLSLQDVLDKLVLFFPARTPAYTVQSVKEGIESKEILTSSSDILPYIQTAFFDDKILEVEIDGVSKVYFSRCHDHPPEPLEEEEENEETAPKKSAYKSGDYLKEMTHLITLPLEPGIGNFYIRNCQKILLRFFTTTCAIELGTFCEGLTVVQEMPVLHLSYPVIGRLVKGARAFRAKVPKSLKLLIIIAGKGKMPEMRCKVIDISAEGVSFAIQKKDESVFRIGEKRVLQFVLDDFLHTKVTGIVRHVSKVRGRTSIEYRCGVQFELSTRGLADSIEKLVATTQRFHLQELSDLSDRSGVSLIR